MTFVPSLSALVPTPVHTALIISHSHRSFLCLTTPHIPPSRSTMSSTDKTGAPSKRTTFRRRSSSFLAQLKAAGSRSPRSSQETLPTSPGLIAAHSIYSNSVHYRLPHLLVSVPPSSRIPSTENPVRQCLVGIGPILAANSNLSASPQELSVRFVDENSQAFKGDEQINFASDLEALHTTLDKRSASTLKAYDALDTFLDEGGYRDKRALLHRALHQMDFEDFYQSLQRPSGELVDTEWRQYRSMRIKQLSDKDTFNAMKGNRLLIWGVYEAPRKPADVIAEYEDWMIAKVGSSCRSKVVEELSQGGSRGAR